MTHASPTVERRSRGRFASPRADAEERVVDYQVELEDLARTLASQHNADLEVEMADLADDRRRFARYQDVEHAIRHLTRDEQLAAFHALVAHVEADEVREDTARNGRLAALRALTVKAVELRRIFKTDFVPRILAGVAEASR